MFGSSSLRSSGNNKKTKAQKNNYGSATSTTESPNGGDYGVVITHPVPPPFDPSFRSIGRLQVPSESDIYGSRRHGERQGDIDDNWKAANDRFDHGYQPGFDYATVMHPEDVMMHMPNAHMNNDETHSDDQPDEQPCTLGCLNSEYLCPRSCECVPKFTKCNGELDCSLGEDEEECVGRLKNLNF